MHVDRNAWRRVQCDRGPDSIDVALRDLMGFQEGACGIRAVHLESLGSAAVLRRQAHVMKHRARVEQLPVEGQAPPKASQRREIIDPTRMVEEQLRLGLANKLGDLAAQLGIGDADRVDLGHESAPLDLIVDVTQRLRCVRMLTEAIPSWQNLR